MITVIFEETLKETESSFQDFILKNDNLILIEIKTEQKPKKNILGIFKNETVITAIFEEKELEEDYYNE